MKTAYLTGNAGRFLFLSLIVLTFSFLGCEDQALSPQPGILEVHLKSKTMKFLPHSSSAHHDFLLNFTSLAAYTSKGTYLRLFSDVRATSRFPEIIDLLDTAALLDSSMVISQTYSPPLTFSRIDMILSPVGFSFYNGYNNQRVPVLDSREVGQEITQIPGSIPVHEFKKTIVTITCDVDSSLVEHLDYYVYVPRFWISSVKVQ